MALDDLPMVRPRDAAEWRDWLETNHETSAAIWLVVAKKGSKVPGVTYAEAIEEATAFGWVDSTGRRVDEDTFRLLFARRKRGSTWAQSNKERVERLLAEGRMTPAGLAAVEAAKADGSWDALADVDALLVPSDLADALADDEQAAANWDAFPDSAKKMSLYHIGSAKRRETRAKRIAETVRDAHDNIRRMTP